MPFISVVIPVYNGGKYLPETLDSLLSQSYKNFEIVCVNDSSTDNSLAVLESYSARDPRVRVFTKPNGGLASLSVEYGVYQARGKYYMYSSLDDLFSNDLLEKGAAKALEIDADVVIPNLICYSENKKDSFLQTLWRETVPNPEAITNKEAFVLSLDWRIHGYGLYKIEIVKSVGIHTFCYNSDEYTTRKLLLSCHKIGFSDGIFYYRIDNPNAITKKMSVLLFDVFETNKRLEELAIEEEVGHDTLIRLRELALNDVAIRQKLLYIKGNTEEERKIAARKTKAAYYQIQGKNELFQNNIIRKVLLTNGFSLLKLSMKVRALLS